MRTLIAFLMICSFSAWAGEVSREEASGIIDEMVKSNMISKEEAEKAKARLHTMSSTEWTAINKEAEKKVTEYEGRAPASVDVADPSNSDLAEEQFAAIKSDLKVIAPHTVVNPTQVQETVVAPVVVPATVVEEVKVTETYVPQT